MKNKQISDTFETLILNQECDTDHIPKYINARKTITSRENQRNYPEVKEKLWNKKFWSPSYCLITTGQVTLDQLKRYVENQRKK